MPRLTYDVMGLENRVRSLGQKRHTFYLEPSKAEIISLGFFTPDERVETLPYLEEQVGQLHATYTSGDDPSEQRLHALVRLVHYAQVGLKGFSAFGPDTLYWLGYAGVADLSSNGFFVQAGDESLLGLPQEVLDRWRDELGRSVTAKQDRDLLFSPNVNRAIIVEGEYAISQGAPSEEVVGSMQEILQRVQAYGTETMRYTEESTAEFRFGPSFKTVAELVRRYAPLFEPDPDIDRNPPERQLLDRMNVLPYKGPKEHAASILAECMHDLAAMARERGRRIPLVEASQYLQDGLNNGHRFAVSLERADTFQ